MTHLCFADDLMVFVDGQQRSIEGILDIFEKFARMSGLHISVEKSTLYLAGVSDQKKESILTSFPFAVGELPVKYLGLPLLTKGMTSVDYNPLLEKIRHKISSWTARHLSYAGRMQLLHSVIRSITNFWLSAFRLPSGCIKEIDKLCAAFLWSGPDLNAKKAKVAWLDVCKPFEEGGLGFPLLKISNNVSCLKLIWRIVSDQPSLWVKYVKVMLIGKDSFWSIKESTTKGSWMWRKLLKYRDVAKLFHKIEIVNGEGTSFWFDNWSDMGRLYDLTGPRGTIDMGIPCTSTMAEVFTNHRRRSHRVEYLNAMEAAIEKAKLLRKEGVDLSYWKYSDTSFKKRFVTKNTWRLLRNPEPEKPWCKGVWFKHATPKYSFLTWLAIQDRLATGDKMRRWNHDQNIECCLCRQLEETRNHLFFECSYSREVWRTTTLKLLDFDYTSVWDQIVTLLTTTRHKHDLFLLRYAFQTCVYHLWKERNQRRHGEIPQTSTTLIKLINKNVTNRINSIRRAGDHSYAEVMERWFLTRLS